MANNPNVNKVVYGNQTVMDITDTTAEEGDVVSGKTFYKASGARSTGSAVIPDISNCYQTTDTAETAIADNDYFPFYDTSATVKKKTLWSNIKAKLNEIFYRRSEANILGAKNFVKFPYSNVSQTINNVTFTVNDDGTVLVNTGTGGASAGTAFNLISTANADLKDFPEGRLKLSTNINVSSGIFIIIVRRLNGTNINQSVTASNTPVEFDWSHAGTVYNGYNCEIYISKNIEVSNLLIKPLVRLATDTDNTYQPYAETNYQLTHNKLSYKDNGVLGAKNLLPYPYSHTTKTLNGITYTDNGDGTILVNGTATADSTFDFTSSYAQVPIEDGEYIVSGCPSGGSSSTYMIQYTLRNISAGTTSWLGEFGNGAKFTETSNIKYGYSRILIRSGAVCNNLLFKPMIRLASDPDETWQPYAMTNQELTGKVGTLAPLASPALTGTPTAPTATAGTNTTQIATTAFVQENKTAVIDGLTSSSRTDALSARCGYYLENSDGHVVQRIIQGSGKYRFPYSGYSEYIQTGSIIIPVSDPSSSGTPYKFKSLEVHSTYNSQTRKYEGYAELDIASDLPFNTMVELLIFNVSGFYG